MKILIATVLAALVATAALAKEVNFVGCTADSQKVSLHLTVSDSAKPEIEKHIASAFASVAKLFTAEDLQSAAGFHAFAAALTEEDIDAITLHGAPEIVGECK